MRCNNCGQENKEYARFCEQCGNPLPSGNTAEIGFQTHQEHSDGGVALMAAKSRRNRILVCVAALVLVAACIAGAMFYFNSQKQAEYQGKLRTADKYLQALDYEKAEVAFLEAIELEPKKEEAYIKLADAYTEQGKFSKAEQILKTGKQKVSSSSGKEKLAKRTSAQAERKEQYTSFYNLCRDYQAQYGKAGYELEYDGADTFHMTGLCVSRLYDFNRDGIKELILVYPGENEGGGEEYFGEVWAWQDGKLENVLKRTALAHDQDSGKWLEVTADDKNSYFTLEGGGMYTEYFRYNGTVFQSAFRCEITLDEATGEVLSLINGKEATEEEVAAGYEKFPSQNFDVDLYGGNLEYEPGGMAFRVDLQVLPEAYAEALAEDTNNAVERMAPKSDDKGKQDKSRQYRAYYDLCMEYQEKYGAGTYQAGNGTDELDENFGSRLSGLCAIKLFDFDKDGNEELLLGYAVRNEQYDVGTYEALDYFVEVWSWDGAGTVNVLEQIPACYDQDGCIWIEVAEKNGIMYLLNIEYGGELIKYMKYENEKFVTAYEYEMIWSETDSEPAYRVNGKDYRNFEEAEGAKKEFPERTDLHRISNPEVSNNASGRFYILLTNISEGYADSLMEYNENLLTTLENAE